MCDHNADSMEMEMESGSQSNEFEQLKNKKLEYINICEKNTLFFCHVNRTPKQFTHNAICFNDTFHSFKVHVSPQTFSLIYSYPSIVSHHQEQ